MVPASPKTARLQTAKLLPERQLLKMGQKTKRF
jgi:hypothetical protein